MGRREGRRMALAGFKEKPPERISQKTYIKSKTAAERKTAGVSLAYTKAAVWKYRCLWFDMPQEQQALPK